MQRDPSTRGWPVELRTEWAGHKARFDSIDDKLERLIEASQKAMDDLEPQRAAAKRPRIDPDYENARSTQNHAMLDQVSNNIQRGDMFLTFEGRALLAEARRERLRRQQLRREERKRRNPGPDSSASGGSSNGSTR